MMQVSELPRQTNERRSEELNTKESPGTIPLPINGMTNAPFFAKLDDEVETPIVLDDKELGSMENQKSVIMHLISQFKEGKDLTKITLPTFILERRSLLEMFADYNAHPQMLVDVTDGSTPHERMKRFVKWFLTAFHSSQKVSTQDKVARKPYNPILGETFQCSWRLPQTTPAAATTAKVATEESASGETAPKSVEEPLILTFCGEQISHHPPVSAFQISCPKRRLQLLGAVHTASRFRGLSIFVNFIGKVVLKLGEHNEDYIFSLPTAYGRSILTVPWFELGDNLTIECPQTGYTANIKFFTKTMTSKRLHQVTAEVFAPVANEAPKKPVVTVTGHWNSTLEFTDNVYGIRELIDTTKLEILPKWVRPLSMQNPEESQKLWANVSNALRVGDIDQATIEKTKLEEVQRISEQARTNKNIKHIPKYFKETPNGYIFLNPQEIANKHSDLTL